MEVTRLMMGMKPQQQTVGPWVYPKSKDVLAATRLKPVTTYIVWRQQNIAKTTEGGILFEECREAEKQHGSPPYQFRWEQEMGLDADTTR